MMSTSTIATRVFIIHTTFRVANDAVVIVDVLTFVAIIRFMLVEHHIFRS